MITGYNTDVRYREKVFHVQTEDKGLSNPTIESVVYIGGRVLLAKRGNYSDLVDAGKGEAEIAARMDQQHRMMIAAVRTGRIDAKLIEAGVFTEAELASTEDGAPAGAGLLAASKEESGPTLDQVILDYLTTEAQQDSLELQLDGEPSLKPGATIPVRLVASSGKTGLPVSGAKISVRMISTVHEPLSLGDGTTDEDGGLDIDLEIPAQDRGAAAIIFSATSLIGGSELKYLL